MPPAGRTAAVLLTAGIMVLAVNLRASITSLPPVFPELSAALHLSNGSITVLAAVPVICFGLFSGLGGPLSRSFGEERVLLAALLLLAAGLLLRGALPGSMLFPGTVLAGGAIALMMLLARKFWQLYRDFRDHVPGSRLAMRTVVMFGALVIAPLESIAWFEIMVIEPNALIVAVLGPVKVAPVK